MKPSFPLTAIFFISFILLSGRCKKDKLPDPVLPPATQEGKNTIGFKVNGNIWLPYYECGFGSDPCGEISAKYGPPDNVNDHFAFQVAKRYGTRHSSLSIGSFVPITTTGNKFDSVNINFRGENSSGNTDEWGKSLIGPQGVFEVTKVDRVARTISGIFSFTLYENNGSGRTLDITEGRFDFKMNACHCR